MKALTWQASNTVSVEEVRDPQIQEPTDAVIRVTSTAICGSDLHLYGVLAPFMDEGGIITMGPWASSRGSAQPSPTSSRGSGGHPLQRFLRALLHVSPGPAVAV